MPAIRGAVSVSRALATSLGTAVRPAQAQTAPPSLIVVIHNYAAVPPDDLQQARAIATKIYRRTGVKLDWWDTSRPGTEDPTDPAAPPTWPTAAIHVRLIGDSPDLRQRISARELGFAASGATLATVLVKLVEQLASNTRLNVGELLGVVMAHEIGHLLLPPNSHTAGGIMSPDLDLFRLEHAKRVMFGSDFPDQVRGGIDAILAADFLSSEQKSDILCNNAARFLRLDPSLCTP